jgi:tetratricopeptide (TPR) repeat protein
VNTQPAPSADTVFAQAVREHQAGALDTAARLYTAILGRDPNHADALRLFGVLYHQRGDSAAGERLIRQAIAATPDNPKAYDNLALVLLGRNARDEALAALDRAVALNPRSEASCYNRATLLAEFGRTAEAVESYRAALALNPRNAGAHHALSGVLLKQGEAEAALFHAEECLKIVPRDATALSFKAIALSETGDLAALNRLVDLDRFIRSASVGATIGGMSLPAFNAALARHIETHPTLRQVPSTVNGHDTKELLNSGDPLCAALRDFVVEQISAYAACLPADPAHPLTAGRPQRHTMESWGVVMWAQGYQVSHVHKKAWISGVYYVQLPGVIDETRADNAGWIEFGHGPADLYARSTPPVRRIKPVEGTLITFPSYVWHRTIPFESAQRRICISFDVIPA